MLKKFNIVLILLMLISLSNSVCSENTLATAQGESTTSMMQNAYNAVAAQLHQAKKSTSQLLFSPFSRSKKVPKGMTAAQALLLVQQFINDKPHGNADIAVYWQTNSSLFLKCTKIVLETTENEILKTLQEIDKRLLYWLYQRDHQWQYFFSKNPLKWMMGKKQDEEIDANIAQLQGKQDELFIHLGEMSAIDWHQYLVAMNDYQAAYTWIEKGLSIAVGMHGDVTRVENSDYGVIVNTLAAALKNVSVVEATILLSIADTAMPHYIMRNWMRYGGLMMAGYWAYQSPVVSEFISSLPDKAAQLQNTLDKNIKLIKTLINDTFFGGRSAMTASEALGLSQNGSGFLVHPETRQETRRSLEQYLDRSIKQGWIYSDTFAATSEEKQRILTAFDKNDTGPFETFYEKALASISNIKEPGYMRDGLMIWVRVLKACTGNSAEKVIFTIVNQLDKESQGLRNLVLLLPAALGAGIGAYGLTKAYERFTYYDYRVIRLALLAISALLVDITKPLDDLEYGKMLFLVYNLKKKARKELSIKNNVRIDFINDLEKIESREFDSAAKRRIIEDMFKKYTFLGLVQ